MPNQTPPSQIILFSQPRTGCHLLERLIFSKQAKLKQLWHPVQAPKPTMQKFLVAAHEGREDEEARKQYEVECEVAFESWRGALKEANQEGVPLYVHTHTFMAALDLDRAVAFAMDPHNDSPKAGKIFSDIPESILLQPRTTPLITIRNPLLQAPSLLKAVKHDPTVDHTLPSKRWIYLIGQSLHWSREIHDWYVSNGVNPVIVDADDYMTSPTFAAHICSALGLNPDEANVKWEPLSKEEYEKQHEVLRAIQGTLYQSEGLVRGRAAKNQDLVEARKKWEEEFSGEEVEFLDELVELTRPHYEYLFRRRLQNPEEERLR